MRREIADKPEAKTFPMSVRAKDRDVFDWCGRLALDSDKSIARTMLKKLRLVMEWEKKRGREFLGAAEAVGPSTHYPPPDRAALVSNDQGAVSSAPISEDEARAIAGQAAAERLAQESERKQKAAAPTGGKPGPVVGAARRSK